MRRIIGSLTLIVIATLALPTGAAAYDEVLIAPDSPKNTFVTDIAQGSEIGLVWQRAKHSYLSWSDDGGQTFKPPVALRNGGKAKKPRLAACGDHFWAVSEYQGAQPKVGVDHFVASGGSLTANRFQLGVGHHVNIACMDDIAAVTWMDETSHIWLAIVEANCSNPCTPAFVTDVGMADNTATITDIDGGFLLAWNWIGIEYTRFMVDTSSGINVTPEPTASLVNVNYVYSPQAAADGSRVVIAYGRSGQTHMRISDDGGLTFGPRKIISTFCFDCPEGGSGPNSVDVDGSRILVEIGKGAGIPTAIWNQGFLTSNDGAKWKKTATHSGGEQYGVLIDGGVAETWDASDYAYRPSVLNEIRFHAIAFP